MGQERAFDETGEKTSPVRRRDERVASTSQRTHGPWRTIISRAGLLLASTLVGLVILECGVRVFLPRYIPCEAVVFHMDGQPVDIFGDAGLDLSGPQTAGDYESSVPIDA